METEGLGIQNCLDYNIYCMYCVCVCVYSIYTHRAIYILMYKYISILHTHTYIFSEVGTFVTFLIVVIKYLKKISLMKERAWAWACF